MDGMAVTLSQMETLLRQMDALNQAVPAAFSTAEGNYLTSIDAKAPELENAFQSTLNGGFANVYLTTAVAAFLALLMLAFYRSMVATKTKMAGGSKQ